MVFLQKFDPTGKEPTQSEGYCLICAKQLGIGPVSDMLEKMGIDDDQLENMSDELSGLWKLSFWNPWRFSDGSRRNCRDFRRSSRD